MKEAGQKKLSYKIIKKQDANGLKMHTMMAYLIAKHHEDLEGARIGLAWNLTWRPDADGRATLGKCRLVGSLDREFMEFDFIVILLREWWEDADVTDDHRKALLDHELCHAMQVLDKAGEPKEDERGRKLWRLRKHDIEEFSEIVDRYGCYTKDLAMFATAMTRGKQRNLFAKPEAAEDDTAAEAVT